MKNKTGVCRALLLVGMGLMIPCYLFTAGNTLLSPWPLYDRNRLALCLLTPLCLLLLLLLPEHRHTVSPSAQTVPFPLPGSRS